MIDQFDSFVEDFLSEKSDRLLVIVCASKVDDLLSVILEKFLLQRISGSKDDLLEGDQPLATFSSRIKMTYRLGIIDIQLFKTLEQLRAIRNKSAHNITFDIQRPPFKDHVNNIKNTLSSRMSFLLVKQRYFRNEINTNAKELQCILLTLCVIIQAINEATKTIQPNEETIRISKR